MTHGSKFPGSWSAGKGKVEDLDQTTTQAPAITQETVKPTKHEIIEERISREIHTHEVFHTIQPVLQREVLPTKHYIQSENGKVKEIAEEDLPKYVQLPEDTPVASSADQSPASDIPPAGEQKESGLSL